MRNSNNQKPKGDVMKGDAGELCLKYAEYSDAAGKHDIPIRVSVTRKTLLNTVAAKVGKISRLTRGSPLMIGQHRIVTVDDAAGMSLLGEQE